jgi:hypothetical protein
MTVHLPITIDPRQLVPEGSEFNGDLDVRCMCGRTTKLKDVRLCWMHRQGTPTFAYYAACGLGCVIVRASQGDA